MNIYGGSMSALSFGFTSAAATTLFLRPVMILNNCVFINNTAYSAAGGARGLISYATAQNFLLDYIATINITNATIINNISPSSAAGQGIGYFFAPTLVVNIIGGVYKNNQ